MKYLEKRIVLSLFWKEDRDSTSRGQLDGLREIVTDVGTEVWEEESKAI